jgi:hypothetical protein
MSYSEKKHKRQLKRNEKKKKRNKNIALLCIDVSDTTTMYNSKTHPIQRKNKSILSLHKSIHKQNKQKTVEGYRK